MKNQLLKKFLELKKQYAEQNPALENYFSNEQPTSTETHATTQKRAQEYLQNTSLKKKLDTLIGQIEAELNKAESDINYASFTDKMKLAQTILDELHEKTKSTWKKVIDSFFFQLLLVFLLKSFVFGWYCVPTGSAEPNLLVGDRILANKMAYWFSPVKRGDLVVFDNPEIKYSKNLMLYLWQRFVGIKIPFLGLPEGPDNFVKRVIGIPGDIIEGRVEDGHPVIYRNGQKLSESYVNPYPLIAVQKMNGFFPASNPVMKFFAKMRNSAAIQAITLVSVAGIWYLINPTDIFPDLGLELSSFAVGCIAVAASHLMKYLEIRKSENCDGHPSFYTYDPEKSYADQPFYKIEPKEIVKNPFSGKPFFRKAGEPELGSNSDSFMQMRIPQGKYWCQGDSRRNSRDCRTWGMLDGSLIRGQASVIVYSINSEEVWWLFDILKNPLTFWSKRFRPERSFTVLKNPLPTAEQI
jgi:signal peptidase I